MPSRVFLCIPSHLVLYLVVVLGCKAYAGITMLTDKRFRLERATVAVKVVHSKRTAFTVPAGAIVKVLPDPADNHELVTVLWGEHKLQMFAVDVDVRGTEIKDPETEHGQLRKTATG
jgi:hypothetical protein